jgi:hypothetical protein
VDCNNSKVIEFSLSTLLVVFCCLLVVDIERSKKFRYGKNIYCVMEGSVLQICGERFRS